MGSRPRTSLACSSPSRRSPRSRSPLPLRRLRLSLRRMPMPRRSQRRVTLNQLLKACTPFPTMLFGMVIEHKSFTWPMMLAVLLIVVGAGLAVPMEDATGSTYGLIMAGLSTLFAACKISLAARLMSDSANNGLTPLILLFYSSLASVPVLLIWFLAIEERTEVPEYIAERPGTAFVALSLASVYAFGVQLLGNTLTKITSALTMTIAGAG